MTAEANQYFLLVYDRSQRAVAIERFADDGERAAAEYSRREHKYADRPEIEVVLLAADSLETIKKTHSHYFRESSDSLLADLERLLTAA